MKIRGQWSEQQISTYLQESIIPARVAVNTPVGMPLVLSLWFLQRDGAHPNVRGVEVLVARILPSVLEALGVTAEGG